MQTNNITPPVNYGQNAGYIQNSCVYSYPIPQGKDEKVGTYWYHPDHLGSSSFITGIDGEVTQNIEYFPSGEVFVENHKNSYNTPYKFNGKEQDSETGYYYYGARYYNPRVSLWLNVDPLADYNPFYNSEHYIDGEHNGGVYNSGNLNPYIYTYQNPIRYIDPNGKQVDMHQGYNDAMMLMRAKSPAERDAVRNMIQMRSEGTLMGASLFLPGPEDIIFASRAFSWLRGISWFKRAESIWKMSPIGPNNRGVVYEKLLEKAGVIKGLFKASNFKAFDSFSDGVATSVKTLNLKDPTYLNKPSAIYSKLKGYLDDMINFTSDTKLAQSLDNSQIKKKVMELGVPEGATKSQLKQLERVKEYAKKNNIEVNIRQVK